MQKYKKRINLWKYHKEKLIINLREIKTKKLEFTWQYSKINKYT